MSPSHEDLDSEWVNSEGLKKIQTQLTRTIKSLGDKSSFQRFLPMSEIEEINKTIEILEALKRHLVQAKERKKIEEKREAEEEKFAYTKASGLIKSIIGNFSIEQRVSAILKFNSGQYDTEVTLRHIKDRLEEFGYSNFIQYMENRLKEIVRVNTMNIVLYVQRSVRWYETKSPYLSLITKELVDAKISQYFDEAIPINGDLLKQLLVQAKLTESNAKPEII